MKRTTDEQFEKIYNKYYKLVYFIVSKYVGDRFERENLVHDIFLKFYEKQEGVENVKYYLARAARSTAIDFLRKEKNISVPLDDAANFVFADVGSSSYYNSAVEDMKKVLSDEEIEIVLSHAVFDEPFKEIAERHGKPLIAVYRIYKRAIKKYKKFSEENCDE